MGTLTYRGRRNIIGVLGWLRASRPILKKGESLLSRTSNVTNGLMCTLCTVQAAGHEWTVETTGSMYWTRCMAFGTDSGQRPRRLHLHTQRAPRKPCRISAIDKTTWLCSASHRYLLSAAKAPFCSHSSSTASPCALSARPYSCQTEL